MKRNRPLTQVLETRVIFDLPDWFGERHGWEDWRSFKLITGNTAHDALFRLKGVKELCHHVQAKWVVVEFDCQSKNLPRFIRRFEAKLNRFLRRYKEAR